MLLGNKKKQGEEQNWCIVLNPLQNEIDKKRVSRKISEIFSLSAEEAADLVCNTPIILLDNLTRRAASEAKDIFTGTGAHIVVTNDIFFKRKCYRTVWPEPPNLSFLLGGIERQSAPPAETSEKKLDPKSALQAIRSLTDFEDPAEIPVHTADRKKILEEMEAWRRECMNRRSEVERLQAALTRLQSEQDARLKSENQRLKEEREKQMREARAVTGGLEEKYEALKTEYRQARVLFEEKMAQAIKQREEAQSRLLAFQKKMQDFEEERRLYEERLRSMEKQRVQALSDLEAFRRKEAAGVEAVLRAQVAEEKIKDTEKLLAAARQEKNQLEKTAREQRDLLQLRLKDAEGENRQLREKNEELLEAADRIQEELCGRQEAVRELEEQILALRGRLEEVASRLKEAEERALEAGSQLTQAGEREAALKAELEAAARELESRQAGTAETERKTAELESRLQEKTAQIGQLEERLKKSEEIRDQARVEIEKQLQERNAAFAELRHRFGKKEDEAAMLREEFLRQQQREKESSALLEAREAELEDMRKRLQNLDVQMEQMAAMLQQRQLAEKVEEKESQLKRLVEEQARIEAEIRQREEAMRRVLQLQESVEREIIESRQAQRLMDQGRNREPGIPADEGIGGRTKA